MGRRVWNVQAAKIHCLSFMGNMLVFLLHFTFSDIIMKKLLALLEIFIVKIIIFYLET